MCLSWCSSTPSLVGAEEKVFRYSKYKLNIFQNTFLSSFLLMKWVHAAIGWLEDKASLNCSCPWNRPCPWTGEGKLSWCLPGRERGHSWAWAASCGDGVVSQGFLTNEECLLSLSSGLLKATEMFLNYFNLLKVSVMKCFSRLSCLSDFALHGPCGSYQGTLPCFWRSVVQILT